MTRNSGEALRTLIDGNRLYLESGSDDETLRTRLTSEGQIPFCALVTCADSRIMPERIFNLQIGDAFIVRNAGNVVSDSAAASLEYAVAELKVPLICILGHTMCGAIVAALSDIELQGELSTLVNTIGEGLSDQIHACKEADVVSPEILNLAVKQHVKNQVEELMQGTTHLSSLIVANGTMVIGMIHDIETGAVSLLEG